MVCKGINTYFCFECDISVVGAFFLVGGGNIVSSLGTTATTSSPRRRNNGMTEPIHNPSVSAGFRFLSCRNSDQRKHPAKADTRLHENTNPFIHNTIELHSHLSLIVHFWSLFSSHNLPSFLSFLAFWASQMKYMYIYIYKDATRYWEVDVMHRFNLISYISNISLCAGWLTLTIVDRCIN